MATEKTIYVLPDGRLWIDDANLPPTATVERTHPQTGEVTVVPNVPINWNEYTSPQLPGLSADSLPELIKQAVRTLQVENGRRVNATSGPNDILGLKITLRQP